MTRAEKLWLIAIGAWIVAAGVIAFRPHRGPVVVVVPVDEPAVFERPE